MDANEIIKKHLETNGYDGLANDDCGCWNDDLIICNSDPSECVGGYETKCLNCGTKLMAFVKDAKIETCEGC